VVAAVVAAVGAAVGRAVQLRVPGVPQPVPRRVLGQAVPPLAVVLLEERRPQGAVEAAGAVVLHSICPSLGRSSRM
jgi:hypothetical protein